MLSFRIGLKCCAALAVAMAIVPFDAYAQSGKGGRSAALADRNVRVSNVSETVACAEKDNVTLMFYSDVVRRFQISAIHPKYLPTLSHDNWDANWTACKFGAGKVAKKSEPQVKPASGPQRTTERMTLYEEPGQWLVGWRFPTFWRSSGATVSVNGRVEKGLHLVQLWKIRPNGGEEVLVFYPQDGYWRARPRGPKGRDLTAFGSSFLVGPIEMEGRPIVKLRDVQFDPKLERFTLQFARGGSATMTIAELTTKKMVLDIGLDMSVRGLAFVALRSMFVGQTNNDVARVAVREGIRQKRREVGIMTYKGGIVRELWAGRVVPSKHNTSSPDMLFGAFR